MKGLRNALFYRTNVVVHDGDCFYHILLKQHPHSNDRAFRVEVFYGFAGSPPKKPLAVEHFSTKEPAEIAFDRNVAQVEGRGFMPHDPRVHGDHDF
jgi:hypothetical protein